MDAVRRNLEVAINAAGMTLKDASQAIGRNDAYLQQFITRGVPRALKEEDRERLAELLNISEAELGLRRRKQSAGKPGGDVPALRIHAGMGNGGLLSVLADEGGKVLDSDALSGFWSFPEDVRAGMGDTARTYALPVKGDSMEPTLLGGAVVFIDTTHLVPSPPDLYACDYGDGLMVKRIELIPNSDEVRVISDNERYQTYAMKREQLTVYGRVIANFAMRG